MISRRKFLSASVAGAAGAALFGGCDSKTETAKTPDAPGAPSGTLSPNDGPEVKDLKFGMIALTDCSPIVIAHEKGLFKKYGINSTVSKGRAGRPSATRFPTATSRGRTC